MQLRNATIEDVETVLHILSRSRMEFLPYAKSPHSIDEQLRWVRSVLIPANGVVIAETQGEGVAILSTSVSEKIGWIDQLYVAPGYIGQGIGTTLLKHALRVLPVPVRLWTFQQNHLAIRFYQYHGFEIVEYTDGQDNEEKCPDILFEYNKLSA